MQFQYNPDNIGNIEDELIRFTISDKMFLEMLLLKLRHKTIQFGSKLKKKISNEESKLISEIHTLENDLSLVHLTDLIQDKKQELNKTRDHRLKGNLSDLGYNI